MKKNKILVLTFNNFEDTELITSLDVFKRNKIEYDLVSVDNLDQSQGQFNAFVKTTPLKEIDYQNYKALFLPGGQGANALWENQLVLQIVQYFHNEKLNIFAICAAPETLVRAKIITNQKITSYPGLAKIKNNTKNDLEIGDYLITAKNYEVTLEFAKAIVNKLKI